jgi:hypothetical protein
MNLCLPQRVSTQPTSKANGSSALQPDAAVATAQPRMWSVTGDGLSEELDVLAVLKDCTYWI